MRLLRSCKHPIAHAAIWLAPLVVLLITACGSSPTPTPTPVPVLKLVDGGWETLSINNAIAEFIIKHGYDYSVERVAIPDWQTKLADGSVDVMMEGWQQNSRDWYSEVTEKGSVMPLATVYESGPQFFMIPQWVADEYDIRSIFDMEAHWELFKDPADPNRGVFYNCPKGGMCAEVNPVKLESYRLYKTFNIADSASYGELENILNAAQAKEDPVFAYYWAPTPLMRQHDWYILEEPEYSKGCWDAVTAAATNPSLRPVDQSCEYPDPGVQILAHSGLDEKAPDVAGLLRNMAVGLEPLEETAAWAREHQVQEWKEAAVHYLNTYEDRWRSWMPRENFGKVFRALRELERR